MADRVPTRDELTQLLADGTRTVKDLGPQTRAVYDAMIAEQGRPEVTALSAIADPYQAISDVTAAPLKAIGSFVDGGDNYETSTGQNIPDPYGGTSLPELALGAGEAALSFGTGLLGVVGATGAGVLGVIQKYRKNKTWYDAMKDTTESMNSIMGNMVYTPRTEAGKDITAVANAPFMMIDEGTTAAQNLVQSAMGGNVTRTGADPLLVTQFQLAADEIQQYRDRGETVPDALFEKANSLREVIGQQGGFGQANVNNAALFAGISTKALLDFLPDVVGKGRSVVLKREKVKEFRSTAEELGINIKDLPEDQILALADSVSVLTDGQTVTAQRLGTMAERLKRREKIMGDVATQLFDSAKDAEGYYPQVQLKLLDQSMAALLADNTFNFSSLKTARGRLNEFQQIVSDTAFDLLDKDGNVINGYVPINELHMFRMTLNNDLKRMRKSTEIESKAEFDALLGMKNHLDGFIDAQFKADLVSGNAEAITKWKKANSWYTDYKEKFSSSDAVQTIVDNDLTAEQVRNLIVGTGEVLGNPEAGAVVTKLNNIFGNDSAQMEALRKEVIFNLSTPLLQETPNVADFVERVNTLKRKNPTLMSELFQGDALRNLNNLQSMARAQLAVAQRAPTSGGKTGAARQLSLSRILAVNLAPGNSELAKGAAGVQLTKAVLEPLTRYMGEVALGNTTTAKVMSEFYQTDMRTPLLGLANFPKGTAIQASRRAEEEENRGETAARWQGMSQSLRDFNANRAPQ